MAIEVPNGVSACARSASRSEPGLPFGSRQSGREVSGELFGYAIDSSSWTPRCTTMSRQWSER